MIKRLTLGNIQDLVLNFNNIFICSISCNFDAVVFVTVGKFHHCFIFVGFIGFHFFLRRALEEHIYNNVINSIDSCFYYMNEPCSLCLFFSEDKEINVFKNIQPSGGSCPVFLRYAVNSAILLTGIFM